MSRGSRVLSEENAKRRRKLVDSRYGDSVIVSRLIRSIMKDGKASIARAIVYEAMSDACERLPRHIELPEHSDIREKELLMLEKVISIITPRVEVKSRRVGGANYQVPIMVNKDRGITLALRWLVESARNRSEGKPMQFKLAREISATLEGKSSALNKKETQDKMASANRANANLVRNRDQSSKSDSKE
jgi:small subunit ribosomal protein S7